MRDLAEVFGKGFLEQPDWQQSEIAAQRDFTVAAAASERAEASVLAAITRVHTLDLAVAGVVRDNGCAQADAAYWNSEVTARNLHNYELATANAAYLSAQDAQQVIALGTLHAALQLPWTDYLVAWAIVRRDWWTTAQNSYLNWVLARNAEEAAYQTDLSLEYTAKVAANGSAIVARAMTAAIRTEQRDVLNATAQEEYLLSLSVSQSSPAPAENYLLSVAEGHREYAVKVAVARRDYALDDNWAAYDAAQAEAFSDREDWLQAARRNYAAAEASLSATRAFDRATADHALALDLIAAEVARTTAQATAKEDYESARSVLLATLGTNWAALDQLYWAGQSSSLALELDDFASSHGSPWAIYASAEAAARADWVASTSIAEQTQRNAQLGVGTTQKLAEISAGRAWTEDLATADGRVATSIADALLARLGAQATAISGLGGTYSPALPDLPKSSEFGTEYTIAAAPTADYASPASRSSPRVYTVWNWYPYAYWGYYGYYGYYGYGSQWNDYYYWSYATYPHEAASYSGYDAGLAQLRSPRELDLEDYWRINRRGQNYWDAAGKADAVISATPIAIITNYQPAWSEQELVPRNQEAKLPAPATPGAMGSWNADNSSTPLLPALNEAFVLAGNAMAKTILPQGGAAIAAAAASPGITTTAITGIAGWFDGETLEFSEEKFWDNVEMIIPGAKKWFRDAGGTLQRHDIVRSTVGRLEGGGRKMVFHIDVDVTEHDAALAFVEQLVDGTFAPYYKAHQISRGDKAQQAPEALRDYWQWYYKKAGEAAGIGVGVYLGFLSIANEGLDWVVTIKDVLSGDPIAAVAFLPFISNGMVKIVNESGSLLAKITPSELPIVQKFLQAGDKIRDGYKGFTRFKGALVITRADVFAKANLEMNVRRILAGEAPIIGESLVELRSLREGSTTVFHEQTVPYRTSWGNQRKFEQEYWRARLEEAVQNKEVPSEVYAKYVAPSGLFGLSRARQIASYAESDLSRFALDFRKAGGMGRRGNVVVVEYELNGVKQPLKAFSTVGAGGSHGEFLAKNSLPDGAKVTRLFSERQPCQLLIPNCDRMLAREFPHAEITFLVQYGDAASRRAGNAALDAILRGLGL